MIQVLFDEAIQLYTGGASYITVEGNSVEFVLKSIFNTFPQLYIYLISSDNIKRYVLLLDDEWLLDLSDLNKTLQQGSTLSFLEVVPQGSDPVSVGAAFLDVVVTNPDLWMEIGAVTEAIVGSIIITSTMLALSYTIGFLATDIDIPDIYSGSLDNSSNYTFTGIKNTTAAGTAIQLVYGECRTGGQILSLFVDSLDTNTIEALTATSITNDIFLYYQVGLSEGEISEVSQVEINKLPVNFYSAVETVGTVTNASDYYRVGSESQSAMTSFDRVTNTTSINRKILNIEDNLTDIPIEFSAYTPVYGYVGVLEYKQRFKPCKLGMYKPAEFDDGYSTTD